MSAPARGQPLGPIAGVLLAGGQARRMGGGDKCLQPLAGQPLLARMTARAEPQVACLAINANGDPARFAAFGLPVVADSVGPAAGPLAGVLAGMDWAAAHAPECAWLASFATDAPFVPCDLVARLAAAIVARGAEMACAASGGRAQPVFALWPLALRAALREALVAEGIRKVDRWTGRYNLCTVDFAGDAIDPFFNVNRPEDLAAAAALLAD